MLLDVCLFHPTKLYVSYVHPNVCMVNDTTLLERTGAFQAQTSNALLHAHYSGYFRAITQNNSVIVLGILLQGHTVPSKPQFIPVHI